MSDNDLVDLNIYNIFEEKIDIDEKANKIFEYSKKSGITIEKMYQRYRWLKNMNINPNSIHLNENHEMIIDIFDNFNIMLNENDIEYYYTSGILCYLLVNKKLERYHHDLDVFINMNDLQRLEKICKKYNFSLERVFGNRDDGTKRIMLKMYYKNNIEIPITIFMYIKQEDLSILQKDYYINNNGEEFVELIFNSPDISKLSFSKESYLHNHIIYHSITLEALYLCKTGNRPKDIYDCKIFENYVDSKKLNELVQAFKTNKCNKIIKAQDDEYYQFIFSNINSKRKKIIKK